MDEKKFWIGFSLVKGVGSVRMAKLQEYFGSLDIAWEASLPDLVSAGLNRKTVENFALLKKGINLDQYIETFQKKGIQVVFSDSPEYPHNLAQIEQKPPVLYYKGNLKPTDDLAVAIVGTRKISYYGAQVTEELAAKLARSGVTVISGLARGVDAVAHKSTMKAQGRTFAVLGSGVDVVYPPEHRALAEQIVENGALISDYPPGTQPDRINFPPRNRIISGLSKSVVVVEAGEKSGARITRAAFI